MPVTRTRKCPSSQRSAPTRLNATGYSARQYPSKCLDEEPIASQTKKNTTLTPKLARLFFGWRSEQLRYISISYISIIIIVTCHNFHIMRAMTATTMYLSSWSEAVLQTRTSDLPGRRHSLLHCMQPWWLWVLATFVKSEKAPVKQLPSACMLKLIQPACSTVPLVACSCCADGSLEDLNFRSCQPEMD